MADNETRRIEYENFWWDIYYELEDSGFIEKQDRSKALPVKTSTRNEFNWPVLLAVLAVLVVVFLIINKI